MNGMRIFCACSMVVLGALGGVLAARRELAGYRVQCCFADFLLFISEKISYSTEALPEVMEQAARKGPEKLRKFAAEVAKRLDSGALLGQAWCEATRKLADSGEWGSLPKEEIERWNAIGEHLGKTDLVLQKQWLDDTQEICRSRAARREDAVMKRRMLFQRLGILLGSVAGIMML